METMSIQFNELTQMASEQHGSGPELHGLTSGHISSGLVLKHVASTSAKPPIKNEWDLLFQPMFDKYFKSPSAVSTLISATTLLLSDTTRASSSTTSIHKDALSLSNSPNIKATNSPINSTNVEPHKEVAFLAKEEPKNYKEAMIESSLIKAMQEVIHKFKRLEVWELVPRPERAMIISLKWIFKVKLDEYGGVLKNKARLKKAVYSFKQAPRTWYELLSKFLLSQKFVKGVVDPTLFTRKEGNYLILVQIYVDDIIFASTNPIFCDKFANQMSKRFKMSMMGQMSFFLRLQISQSPRGIFINQSKYALEMLKKYGLDQCDAVDIPMVGQSKLDKDPNGTLVDLTRYRGMVGSLMYLTTSRLDLVFVVCMCVGTRKSLPKST
ncbi:retrovirus-related pol polyprotein from transposon TNT 1-94 [Tanacetum coccineum]|uniref:Retrovirus-related pol polyprotein from transposon TNT 1-94 n=1 Tax=Tanacetum coccineum TaxID=301880 RepID=A0ABQ5EU77_9ASTR